MVVSKLTGYLGLVDKNGVKVSSWARQTALPGVAKCIHFDETVTFKAGKKMLFNHSERSKHIGNTPTSDTVIQMTINEFFFFFVALSQKLLSVRPKITDFYLNLTPRTPFRLGFAKHSDYFSFPLSVNP